MSDRAVVGMAVATLVGARLHLDVGVPIVGGLVVLTLLLRARPAALAWIASAAAASLLGVHAWAGLAPPVRPGERLAGIATLVADPESIPGGTRVDLQVAGMRLRATADASAAQLLRGAAAGERWSVRGTYAPLDPVSQQRLASRHIAGRVRLRAATRVDGGTPLARVANQARRIIMRSTPSMSSDQRALFAGIVLGDDRDQQPVQVEDFRSSGLSHLLAVSGQNVAFALAVAAPLLGRLRLGPRLAAGLLVLGVFGTITRWEPSVTRAVGMAAVTLIAAFAGRPIASIRALALAVTALVLVDPLLAHSIGFALSVAACTGLALVAPILGRWLPPALAVTLAAQAAVLPLMLPLLGPVPLAAIPANVLAAPAAGPLMMWGLAAGFVAGVLGEPAGTVAHVPTRLLLEWIAGVARVAAGLPTGWVTTRLAIVVGAVVLVVAASALSRRAPTLRRAMLVVLAAIVVVAALRPLVLPVPLVDVDLGTRGADRAWRRDGVVVVTSDGRAPPGELLSALRQAGIRRVDLLLVTAASRGAGRALEPVRQRIALGAVLAPANHQIAGGIAVETPVVVRAGPFQVDARPAEQGLDVRVQPTAHPNLRG